MNPKNKTRFIILILTGLSLVLMCCKRLPSAAFMGFPLNISEGQSVSFTDQSANNPISWSWYFGDGGASSEQNPSHIYLIAGSYTVTLTVTNSSGSDDEIKPKYVRVTSIVPVAAFTSSVANINAGDTVNFTDQSINNPTSWIWNFGDGETSTQQNPSHIYSTAGRFTISLTVTNSAGSDTETKTEYVIVNPSVPVANFLASPTTLTVGDTLGFFDLSTNNPVSWSWDFGDGGTSNEKNPSHVYTSPGLFTVSLTASNNAGSDEEIRPDYITVKPLTNPPVTAFTAVPVVVKEGGTVNFTDHSSNYPTSWSWDFGDGGTSSIKNPSYIYKYAGTYSVRLTATNSVGSDDLLKDNYITVSPVCIPTLISPPNYSELDNGCYEQNDTISWFFDWSDCEGATKYAIAVYYWSFSENYAVETITSDYHSIIIGYIVYLTGWKWRVRAYINGEWDEWSEEGVFNVEPLDTDCPK